MAVCMCACVVASQGVSRVAVVDSLADMNVQGVVTLTSALRYIHSNPGAVGTLSAEPVASLFPGRYCSPSQSPRRCRALHVYLLAPPPPLPSAFAPVALIPSTVGLDVVFALPATSSTRFVFQSLLERGCVARCSLPRCGMLCGGGCLLWGK